MRCCATGASENERSRLCARRTPNTTVTSPTNTTVWPNSPIVETISGQRVPNSSVQLTLTQIRDFFTPPDWHPEDHPAMPPIVGKGRKPAVWACGYCHLPTGYGKDDIAGFRRGKVV